MIRFNHVALTVLGLLALSIIDSCQGIMESATIIKIVRGGSVPVNGRLSSDLPALERLQGVKNTPEDLGSIRTSMSETGPFSSGVFCLQESS